MPSFIWNRTPAEARANPHEYDAQSQFTREATAFLEKLYVGFDRHARDFFLDERSARKAIWMLQVDALDTLRDCVRLLDEKRHRLAGRLFRDVVETLGLAAYFHCAESSSDLKRWYDNEVIPHRRYRDFVKEALGEEAAYGLRREYQSLSNLSHRTYHSLTQAYILGADGRIVYESILASGILIPPETVSEYYAILAYLIRMFAFEVANLGLLNEEQVEEAWKSSIEPNGVPRRFVPHPPRAGPEKFPFRKGGLRGIS